MGDGLAGDPRGQQVVGVVREVVGDQYVEQVGVAGQVRPRQDDQLALAGSGGERSGPDEVVGVTGEHRRGDEDRRRAARHRSGEDLAGGAGVATDEAAEEVLVGGHGTTLTPAADGALTAADVASDEASDAAPVRP
jgi:hypothetical protein